MYNNLTNVTQLEFCAVSKEAKKAQIHELNNLIMTIQGFADFLCEDLHPGSRLQGYAEKILTAAEQAGTIINESFHDEEENQNLSAEERFINQHKQ